MQADESEKGRIARFFAAEGGTMSSYVRGRLRRMDDMDAEDIVSDVMLHLLQKVGITSRVESLHAYAYRALRNRIVDYQRSRKCTVSLDGCMDENGEIAFIDQLTDLSSDVTGVTERREFFRNLELAIDRLEAKQRAVFLATEFDGKSFHTLSKEWKMPVGTLLSQKSRAMKALREMLREDSMNFRKAEKGND